MRITPSHIIPATIASALLTSPALPTALSAPNHLCWPVPPTQPLPFPPAGLAPKDIDILITNCSIYCPTPSISSMIVNTFKMREDIEAYHLGGMGCSMGVVGLSLVRDMLKAHPGKLCLFVSSEIVTAAFYPGNRREALTSNALFRMGGSASILTNNPRWKSSSKYVMQHCLRVHTGQEDRAYK
jgi:3-ketoacyl-CoA synthase